MLRFIFRRALLALAVAFTVSVVVFALLRLSGDIAAVIAGPGAGKAEIAQVRQSLGLDRPIVVQYAAWLGDVARGDLGRSILARQDVATMIGRRLPTTFALGIAGLVLAVLVAVPLGVLAAVRANSGADRAALAVAVLGQAMPSFWFALVLILIFGVNLRWLPISGSDSWLHFVLPSIALAYYAMPGLMRLTRSGMIEVLGSDYIRTARAKGLGRSRILFRHALRSAAIPVVALASVQLGTMLGGSVIIESVFALNGVGYLAWEAIRSADFPVVQAIVLMFALIYVLVTLLADILNAALDPRLRTA